MALGIPAWGFRRWECRRWECRSRWRLSASLGCGLLVCSLAGAQEYAGQAAAAAESRPDLVLHGTVTGSQNNTYVNAPFQVPAGTYRVTLQFDYTGKEQRTTLDLGMADPDGLRCWSGGNKSVLTVSAADATPSCTPGPVVPGTWNVVMGVPNIRATETSTYTAKLYFAKTGLVADEPSFLRKPIRTGPAWYRGDLHLHTGHSDGSCNSLGKVKVPCPVFLIVDAAARRGLDFIAITDHNATSQYDAMRELAPYFDTLLLIPGREITTFHGHANMFGTEEFLDFRVGTAAVPDTNALLRRAGQLGGLVSLNHPNAPTGEMCMGCGWTPPAADLRLVQAVEAINSGAEEGRYAGTAFWEQQLDRGFRLTGVGGSDNHTAQRPLAQVGSVGSPTTVVYATELSTVAVLDGIHAGHVFVDLTAGYTAGSKDRVDRVLEMTATSGSATAHMGDELMVPKEGKVGFLVHTSGSDGASLAITEDGKPFVDDAASQNLTGAEQTTRFEWTSDGQRHWFRVDVRGPDKKLWLLGNPVYVNWTVAHADAVAP